MPYKVMTILGTRPEIIRLSEVIKACDQFFNHVLVHTGQNYDYKLNEVFFDDLNLRKPNHFLNAVGKDLGETMGHIISKSYDIIKQEKPDAVLILGDTNSALSAISAKRLKVPVFHMEAGNRCFDENVPEEINRRLVDHISDVNLPYTEHSRRYLLSEGIKKEYIFVTGSPMKEVIEKHVNKIDKSTILKTLELTSKKYILVSTHREENVDQENNFYLIIDTLNQLAETYKLPIIVSTHPRTKKWLNSRNYQISSLVRFIEPFSFTDYIHLQQHAFVVLSDSGTLSEESAILNFPAVLFRTSTERPEVIDQGLMVVSGLQAHQVIEAINLQTSSNRKFSLPHDYHDDVSMKVVKIIQSYIPIINQNIWKKL